MRVAGAIRLRSSVAPATEIPGVRRLKSQMRLWSLHPKYLDSRGLVALWREALLAQAVLVGETRGYQHHPQLTRSRKSATPQSALASHSGGVVTTRLSLRQFQNRPRQEPGSDPRHTRLNELRMGTIQSQIAATRSHSMGTDSVSDSTSPASVVSDQTGTDRRLGSRFDFGRSANNIRLRLMTFSKD